VTRGRWLPVSRARLWRVALCGSCLCSFGGWATVYYLRAVHKWSAAPGCYAEGMLYSIWLLGWAGLGAGFLGPPIRSVVGHGAAPARIVLCRCRRIHASADTPGGNPVCGLKPPTG